MQQDTFRNIIFIGCNVHYNFMGGYMTGDSIELHEQRGELGFQKIAAKTGKLVYYSELGKYDFVITEAMLTLGDFTFLGGHAKNGQFFKKRWYQEQETMLSTRENVICLAK